MFNLSVENQKLPELQSLIWEHRDETESNRRLAGAVVDRLVEESAFRMTLETRYGGNEDGPLSWLKGYEMLSRTEAAVGWVVWNNALACSFARFIDEQQRDKIYSDQSLMYANSSRPEGAAAEVDGGYSVSGRWTLVSGCELAEWFVLRCIVKTKSEISGPPPLRFMYIHKNDVNIIDTWSVGGLRGTGSHDIQINDVFVESALTFAFDDPSKIEEHTGQVPICCVNAAGCAAIALGIAGGALDTMKDIALSKVTDSPRPDFRDHLHVQALVARLDSQLSSARLELYSVVEKLWGETQTGQKPTDDSLASVWASAANTASIARGAVSEIYASVGTAALYTSSSIERAHRDIFAVLQHGTIQPHWLSEAGRVKVGLEPKSPVFRI